LKEERALINEIGDRLGRFVEQKHAEKELRRRTHDLKERVKELNCLYGISRLTEARDVSFDDMLQQIVELIPPSWQYPEITCARIVLDGQTFQTDNFRETGWKQSCEIRMHGHDVGMLDICYLKEMPVLDEGPFLKEERDLIHAVGECLGRIIEYKRAEAELRQSEKKYRAIVENTGTGTIILEADLVISMANARWYQLSGFTEKETVGRLKLTDVVVVPDLDGIRNNFCSEGLAERPWEMPEEFECLLMDKSGHRKNTLVTMGVIPGTNKKVASFTDMTSYKNALDALHESQSRLSDILDASSGFIFTVDRHLRIEFMNRALMEYVGHDATGERCCDIGLDLGMPCALCPQKEVFKGRTVKREHQQAADERWYHSIHSPIFGDNGTVMKRQIMVLDITERKIAEETLKKREQHLRQENIRLKNSISERYRFGRIIGKSHPMQKVYRLILRAAASDANVIIYGESGTGKELVAKAIHENSDRSRKEMVCVNCGAIPDNLLEAEFFGYRKGSFTGATGNKNGYLAIADGGVLFMDELGELSLNMQVKLLRAIEGGGFTPIGANAAISTDIRIVAATNRDISDLVSRGLFREDFYYRIHVIPIYLPPLRKRKEDIPLLIDHFLREHHGREPVPAIPGTVIDRLQNYDWPGNVRELQNTLHRYITLGQLDFMGKRKTDTESVGLERMNAAETVENMEGGLQHIMRNVEKEVIARTLKQTNGHRTRAASELGINRKTLFKKMKAYGIKVA
jgi:PAS domain S-box-containing protein